MHRETQLLLEIPHLPLIIMQKPLLVMQPYSVGWSQSEGKLTFFISLWLSNCIAAALAVVLNLLKSDKNLRKTHQP
jgi:hypothetical protein